MSFNPVKLSPKVRQHFPKLYDALINPILSIDAVMEEDSSLGGVSSSNLTSEFEVKPVFNVTVSGDIDDDQYSRFFYQLSYETEQALLKATRTDEKKQDIRLQYKANATRILRYFVDAKVLGAGVGGNDIERLDDEAFKKAANFYKYKIIYWHLKRNSYPGARKKMFAGRFRKMGIPYNIPFEKKLERFMKEYVTCFLGKVGLKDQDTLDKNVDSFLNEILAAPNMSQWILTKDQRG